MRRLVELHGGTILAASGGPGRGSTFTVSLPIATSETPAPPSTVSAAPAAAVRPRVLVVDDNRDGADSLAALLSLAGHEAHVAHDGAHALAQAEALRPDVVLLDIGLPDIDGREVCRRLRAMPWAASIKIVALTGRRDGVDARRSRESGFDAVLIKPVVLDELVALIGT